MRTLKFIVKDQVLIQDPKCDFSGLIPGTEGYLQAEFSFSNDWNGYMKVAGFANVFTGKEYTPQALQDGKTCIIPAEALEKREFYIWVVGKKDGLKLKTNRLTVVQNGGRL